MIAGTPSIVLALFGTVIFSSTALAFLSRDVGRRCLRPLVLRRRVHAFARRAAAGGERDAGRASRRSRSTCARRSFAVGKTKAATTRRILLPAARPSVATGAMLGLGRIIGDTAIIVVLLGATQNFEKTGSVWPLNYLQGAGSTLTNYVYYNAPTGEGNQPQKAYAAAFVLLVLVLFLNAAVDVVHRRSRKAGSWNS